MGEALDPGTGTTVTVLPRPVELLAEFGHDDPSAIFAYIAPFETNRMGERALFLWVATPPTQDPAPQPRVRCEGELLSLSLHDGELKDIGLSRPPYEAPVPWSTQWYFRLPEEALRCLAGARRIALEAGSEGDTSAQFSAEAPALRFVAEFLEQITQQGQVTQQGASHR